MLWLGISILLSSTLLCPQRSAWSALTGPLVLWCLIGFTPQGEEDWGGDATPLASGPVSTSWPSLYQSSLGGGPSHKALCLQVLIITPLIDSLGLEVAPMAGHCSSPGCWTIHHNFSTLCLYLHKQSPYETLLNYPIWVSCVFFLNSYKILLWTAPKEPSTM